MTAASPELTRFPSLAPAHTSQTGSGQLHNAESQKSYRHPVPSPLTPGRADMGKHSDADKPPDQRGDPKDNDSQHPSPHGGGGEKQGK
ncbi:hypothetical protein GCM10009603_58770 [Nocardiopsis exhalans]